MASNDIDALLDRPDVIERVNLRRENARIMDIEARFEEILMKEQGLPTYEGIVLSRFSARCLIGMLVASEKFPVGWTK